LGTPSEIYKYPVDLFIATFIGRGSVLDGRIHVVDDKARVMVNDQIICGLDTTGSLKEGDPAVCILRPEDFTLENPGEQANVLEGVVEWEAFIGPYKEVKLSVEGATVLVDLPPEVETQIGSNLRVYIHHDDTIVLAKS
jgi:ABC-type Fe3+/spermidine/putrescine transport system ATPase subunit